MNSVASASDAARGAFTAAYDTVGVLHDPKSQVNKINLAVHDIYQVNFFAFSNICDQIVTY